jgi:hypothetical protein
MTLPDAPGASLSDKRVLSSCGEVFENAGSKTPESSARIHRFRIAIGADDEATIGRHLTRDAGHRRRHPATRRRRRGGVRPELAATARRRAAHRLGTGRVVPVRLDPELRAAVEARASAEQISTSEIIRQALRRCLGVA